MSKPKVWSVTASVLVLFGLSAWGIGSFVQLSGRNLWILRLLIVLLGLVIALVVHLVLARRSKAPAVPADDEIDQMVAAAQQHLAASGAARASKLKHLPVVLVLGPSGSTKTSTLLHSGLEPELLAGEIYRGEALVPTAAVNLWYAQETVFVEAGGKLVNDDTRWAKLVRHLLPSRVRAAFARGAQAPRAAVVCFGCDELLKPGSGEAVPAAARKLRARLSEVSQQLGIRLPVYVLFTKADRLPYFGDYVRSLTPAEAKEVLGATLPLAPPTSAGAYADQAARRLTDAFSRITHTLALKRLDVLPRDSQLDVRAGAYEFPRELRKTTDLAVQFLTELCKPSQLGVSPFLRGFYFTGVRPIIVSDGGVADAPRPASSGPAVRIGATSVFNPAALTQQPAPQAPAAGGGGRKVPEWVFLRRVLREVVLQDRVALSLTGGGRRVNLLRRTLLAAAAAVLLVYSVGAIASYRNNRALVAELAAAVRGVEHLPVLTGSGRAPAAESFAALDGLRAEAERIARFERDRRPLRYRWGLYTGRRLFPPTRELYFDRFAGQLWGDTRAQLVGTLQNQQDPQDADQFAAAYDALKAYLITGRHPEHSTPAFLTPELLKHWPAGRALDEERLTAAQRQFDFYAAELPHGDPYRDPASDQLVVQVRSSLHRFAGIDRFYQSLLSQAASSGRDVQFNRDVPGSESVLRNQYVVPAAFTDEGWTHVQNNLQNLDALFEREAWVLGEQSVSPQERAQLAQQLRERYLSDYVLHWRSYLRAANVSGYGNLQDAAAKLGRLAGNPSPLLQMFALASQHTNVDSLAVGRAFQPLHEVMPPGQTDRLVGGANEPYVQALLGLQGAMEQAARAPPAERIGALGQASGSADQARLAVRQLAQSFSVEGAARDVGGDVQRVMLMAVDGVGPLVRVDPAGEANAKGAGFCTQFRPLLAKYPFNPRAGTEATIDEVSSVFQRGSGLVSNFFADALQDLLVRTGPTFAPRIGATPQPTRAFVDFYNRANAISEALYDERGAGPEVAFTLRPQLTADFPEITVSVDGQTATSTRTAQRTMTFAWNGARAASARITARTAAGPVTVEAPSGPWALFRLMQQADWAAVGGGQYRLTWTVQGQPLTAIIDFQRGPPVFRADFFANLSCVARVAQ